MEELIDFFVLAQLAAADENILHCKNKFGKVILRFRNEKHVLVFTTV